MMTVHFDASLVHAQTHSCFYGCFCRFALVNCLKEFGLCIYSLDAVADIQLMISLLWRQ